MTEKKKQFSVSVGSGYRLGAYPEKGGILFSVAAWGEEPVSLLLYRKGSEEVEAEIPFPNPSFSGYVHSMKVAGISAREYEYNFRIGKRIVTDPYARKVVGKPSFDNLTEEKEPQIRGAFLQERFDWGEEENLPEIPYEEVIAYQLHVRGFTKQRNSKVSHKGTFLGVQEKIPYLKELGINQVILMPVYEFEDKIETPGMLQSGNMEVRRNYWGYAPGYYFAPKAAYSASGNPHQEFQSMVKAFHKNGMEVILQFYFPNPVDLAMVNECLIWWMQEYHVDGFQLMMDPAAAEKVAENPYLGRVKLITDYFSAERIYPNGRQERMRNLAECNDGFKVDARRLLKGDEDVLAAFVGRTRNHPKDCGVMNYVTNQNGFTLMDLVSYDKKHNEENGEQGLDGSDYNFSWNCGAEGPTRRKKIQELRLRQMKNAFAMLLLAQGTPVILAGDEFGNSQGGNNNPYCQDNEISWVDWKKEKAGNELTAFVKKLIAFRKEHKILHMEKALTGSDLCSIGYPDLSIHGSRAWYGGMEPVNRHVGLMYCGQYAGQEEFLYIAYNLHWEPQKLALPFLPEEMEWQKVLDTNQTEENESQKETEGVFYEKEFEVPPRSIQILISKKTEKNKKKRINRKRIEGNDE